jgi:3,4-dihydroxy-2-butanone 4-phosphate synthase
MTTRHGGYVVVLEDDIREDDAKLIINALKCIKGVLSVQPIEGGQTIGEVIAASRVSAQWRDQLVNLIQGMKIV